MRKLGTVVKKEFILLFRDFPGLIILFLMPALLIFVVTLAQDYALKSQSEKTRVLLAGTGAPELKAKFAESLDSSGFFLPVTEIRHERLTTELAGILIADGDFHFGLIIPGKDSAVVLLSDPTLQETYRRSVLNSLKFIVRGTQTREAVNEIFGLMPAEMQPMVRALVKERMAKIPAVKESYALRDKNSIQPSIVQNNVPGFILFAMFFIVIPLAGSLVTEKNEGSFQRLRSLPVRMATILSGKVIAFVIVCLAQFFLMMTIGIWVFPTFFNMPALEVGHQHFAILVATIAASLAAVGFGMLVGAFATTHAQAALSGSVMVVVLGIISGTFLPIHIMPAFIRILSNLSPIRWGIDNYLDLFIRDGNLGTILPRLMLLLAFFIFALTGSIVIFAKKN